MPVSPSTQFYASTVNVPLPSRRTNDWVANRKAVSGAVKSLGQNPMMGATNLSTGLDSAVAMLNGNTAGTYVNKVVVLMTDGQWNDGRDPIAAGKDARDAGVIVHTVSMLTKRQPELEQIALMTGGRHYATQNEKELIEAFREIARSLPIVLIQ
jgi:Mg-chelatase subunit ChlD